MEAVLPIETEIYKNPKMVDTKEYNNNFFERKDLKKADRRDSRSWSKTRRHTVDHQTAISPRLRISQSGRVSMKDKHGKNRISLGFGDAAESLMTMLKNPDAVQIFRGFLKSEYSEENLDFWLECESYRQQKLSKIQKHANKIFQTYIDTNSPKEVNLDASTRAVTIKSLKSPDKQTFVEAQNHIFQLMEADSFRRFMTSNNNNRCWK